MYKADSIQTTLTLPSYPSINGTAFRCILAAIRGGKRSLHEDSARLCRAVDPPIHYEGVEFLRQPRPLAVIANHYSRPGFSTAWIALGISAALPDEVTWIMSNQWLFQGNPLGFLLRPLMRLVLGCINRAYAFIAMPTMVDGFSTPQERTAGVRETIERLRSHSVSVLGITPEGMDSPDGRLMLPPPGAGRFLLHLQQMGLPLVPAGVSEADGRLNIRFGQAFRFEIDEDQTAALVDLQARELVRQRIAQLLPGSNGRL